MMRLLDVAIAGCGPGGLAAALLLRRDGHRVRIYERFAKPRPIGSGLMIQPTGRAVLGELDLLDKLTARSARITRLFGQAGGRTVLDVQYAALAHDCAFGLGTHRTALFDVLFDAVVDDDIVIETGRTVASSRVVGNKRSLNFTDGTQAGPFDLIVDASGTSSALAPPTGKNLAYGALWATLDWPSDGPFDEATLEQRYFRASIMSGVLPLGRGRPDRDPQVAFFWSLRADQGTNWSERGIDAWKTDVLKLWPQTECLLEQIRQPDQLTFARYAHRTLECPTDTALVHIGDAWHSASPQLGQGANMALLDAFAIRAALRDREDVDRALDTYRRARIEHVRLYQLMSALFTPVYQSDSRVLPFLRDQLVGPFAKRWPANWILASMVSGLIGDPLTPLGLKL